MEGIKINTKELSNDEFIRHLMGVKGHWMSLQALFTFDNFSKEIIAARAKGVPDRKIIDTFREWCINQNDGYDLHGNSIKEGTIGLFNLKDLNHEIQTP